MDKKNCSSGYYHNYGRSDSSKFGEPLPWIGLYVASASLACLLLMTSDLLRSFKWKKGWIPSKFFAFNAATLTLLAVATKVASDVTGAMPGLIDQFVKLSGIFLLCMAMSHAMPSVGAMDGLTISSNMIALGIMVVSMFVNIWLQLSTGLIDKHFRYVYAFSSIYMLLLLLLLLSHSLTVSASRRILYKQYYEKHEQILREISGVDASARFSDGKLEEYISKYWLMALTSSPDYTLSTSELSSFSANLNVNLFIFGTTFLIKGNYIKTGVRLSCLARSDYSWSTLVILSVQVLAIAIGGISSHIRISFSKISTARRNLLKNERYRYELMMEWIDRPLPVWISNKRFRQAMRKLRAMLLRVLIILQFLVITIIRIIILISAFIGFIIIIFLSLPFRILGTCFNGKPDSTANTRSNVDMSRSNVDMSRSNVDMSRSNVGMSRYVLYVEDEEDNEQSESIAENWQNHPTTWIDRGRANQPANLDRLLRNDSLPEAIRAVYEFYSRQSGPYVEPYRKPPICWTLPIVTLASILYATSPRREELLLAVGESLRYIRLVDSNMDERGTGRMQKAADIAWEKLYLQNRWMNVDLKKTSSKTFSDVIDQLRQEAVKDISQDYNNDEYCPMTVFIANCMYTTTEIILERNSGGFRSNLHWSVERLEKVMVGLLGACLTNLQFAIFKHCSSGTFGRREDKVREAATIFGETREIVTLLEVTAGLVPNYPEQKEYFESWCGR